MRAYSSNSLRPAKQGGGRWKWFVAGFVLGFIGGFVVAKILEVREPVELVVSTPRQDFPLENLGGQAPNAPEVWSDSGNISVRAPQPNAIVKSPLTVEGMERIFEQTVAVRLKDAKGNELAKASVVGSAPDAGIHGPYHGELTFQKPATKTGTVEVFQSSPKDGSEIDKVTVPVRFE